MGDDGDLFGDDENPSLEHADGAFGDAGDRRRELLAREIKDGKARPGDEAERNAGKRGPGRPKGSQNRKSRDFEKWYAAMGYRDPMMVLGELVSTDPVELQAWYIAHERTVKAIGKGKFVQDVPTLAEINRDRARAAETIAPYLHGKKPVELQIIDERLPALIIDLGSDQLERGRQLADAQVLSIGYPVPEAEASKINDLSDDDE